VVTPLFYVCQICAKSRPKDTAQFRLPSNGQNNGKRYLYYICAVCDVNTEVLEKPSNRFRKPRAGCIGHEQRLCAFGLSSYITFCKIQ
jgi:hypothetical protein